MNYKKSFTKVFSIMVLAALILSSFGSSAAYAASQPQGSGNPYFNTEKPSTGRLAKPTKDSIDPNKPVRAIVQLLDAPLASYRGGKAGLPATSPKATGAKKLNVETSASRSYLSYLAEQQAAFTDSLTSSLPDAQIERSFQIALNGLTVKTTYGNLAAIRALPGVKSVIPEKEFKPTMDASIPLIGLGTGTLGDPAWTDTGLWAAVGGHEHAGEGVKIADIDSGITPDHPCFDGTGYTYPAGFPKGDTTVTNRKIIAAYAYFRPDDPPYNPPTPIDDPATEEGGHGTHTAGIMACNYGVESNMLGTMISGVAPKAQLMIYRVFYHSMAGDDSAFTPELVAAIEQAIKDGADVVNNSWGGTIVDTIDDPEVAAYSAAVDAGMVVIFSAGNAGSAAMTLGSPGNGDKFITVGASTTDRVFAFTLNAVTADPNGQNVPAVPGDGPAITSDITGDYLYTNAGGNGIGCSSFAGGTFTGKIAVIMRGTCTFAEKVTNAYAAGATAVVIVNSQAGPPSAMSGLTETTIPSVMIPNANAAYFTSTAKTGNLTITANLARISNPAYQDVVAGFSSRGPTPDLLIKPDLTAPGVNILSSVSPLTAGSSPTFELYQGTSMAAPHVTAAAALLVQRNPSWTPAQIKSALMSTAVEPSSLGSNPTNRGAGRLNLSDTNRPDQVLATFDKPSVSFGALPHGASKSVTITATNPTATAVTYDVSVTNKSGADTPTTAATLTVPANGSASFDLALTVTATFIPAPEVGVTSYSEYGKVVLAPHSGGSPTLHIPYWARVLPVLANAEILLVNDYDPDAYYNGEPTTGCTNYISNYENVLDNIGATYTEWDTAVWGYIDYNVARRYSKVLYFSGNCGYTLTTQGNDLANYLAQGGKMIITGQDIGYWDNALLNIYGISFNPSLYFGASFVQDSLYRGNPPPTPAMKGDDVYSNFLQGQFYDITDTGNGAGNQNYVDEIQPKYYGDVDALPILTSQPVFTQVADGVVGSRMSSEPTIERVKGESSWTKLGYRTVWLSFGLEGVNNNTGFDKREDLLARALAFLDDTISITPAKTSYTSLVNATVNLSETTTASFTSGLPYAGSSYVNQVLYTLWNFGDGTPSTPGGSSINHVYKKVGTYKVYVEAGDGFGHKAVAGPMTVNVVNVPAAPKTVTPNGTTTNHTPKFTWTKVSGANQYFLEVYYYTPGKYVVSQIVTSPSCNATYCSFTPAVVLKPGTYKWRVRAGVSGVWGSPSPWRAFKVVSH